MCTKMSPMGTVPLQGAQLTKTSLALRKMISKGWYSAMCVELDVILSHIHITPGKFGNAVLFLQFDLPSTVIRHENKTFGKRSSNLRNLKTPALRFSVDGKHFDDGAFRKRWRHHYHVIFLPQFSSNTNSKCSMIIVFLNSSGVGWTKNIWYAFNVDPPFSNCCSVVAQGLTKSIWIAWLILYRLLVNHIWPEKR